VQVPELAKLEKFAQVQHLVSTVEGRLRKGRDGIFAAFRVVFFPAAASPARRNSARWRSLTSSNPFRAGRIAARLATLDL